MTNKRCLSSFDKGGLALFWILAVESLFDEGFSLLQVAVTQAGRLPQHIQDPFTPLQGQRGVLRDLFGITVGNGDQFRPGNQTPFSTFFSNTGPSMISFLLFRKGTST